MRCEVDTDEVWPSLTRVFLPSSDPQLVHVETPSNPLMRITDIRALADALHEQGVLLSVDATMMTPLLMRPLDLGAVRLVVVVVVGGGGCSSVEVAVDVVVVVALATALA